MKLSRRSAVGTSLITTSARPLASLPAAGGGRQLSL